MRKHISFSTAATIVGLAMVFWAIFGVVYTKAEIYRNGPSGRLPERRAEAEALHHDHDAGRRG